MSSLKVPITLFAILLLLGGVAYWDEQQTERDEKLLEQKNLVFESFSEEDILSFNVLENGEENVALTKNVEGSWQIIRPKILGADQSQVQSVLAGISGLRLTRDLGVRPNLAEYGLSEPQYAISFKRVGNQELGLSIGKNSPVGGGVYASPLGEDRVILLSEASVLGVRKTLADLRDRSLGFASLDDLSRWQIKSSEGSLSFVKREGFWHLDEQGARSLDAESLLTHIKAFDGPVIQEFVDQPSKALKAALSPSQSGTAYLGAISWGGGNSDEIKRLEIVENNETLYGTFNEGQSYVRLDEKVKQEFVKTRWDFLDKRIVKFDSNKVSELVFDGQGYTKDGNGNWQLTGDKGEVQEHIRLLLVDLEFSQVLAFEKEVPALNADKPQHQLLVKLEDEKEYRIDIWQHPKIKGELVLKLAGESDFFIVPASIAENFSKAETKREKS